MKRLLFIASSEKREKSSLKLGAEFFVRKWIDKFPDDEIVERDIGMVPISHLKKLSQDEFSDTGSLDDLTSKSVNEICLEFMLSDFILFEVQKKDYSMLEKLMNYFSCFSHINRSSESFYVNDHDNFQKKKVVIITSEDICEENTQRSIETMFKPLLCSIGIENITVITSVYSQLDAALSKPEILDFDMKIKKYISNVSPYATNHTVNTLFKICDNLCPSKIQNSENIKIYAPSLAELNKNKMKWLCQFINSIYTEAEMGMWEGPLNRVNENSLTQLLSSQTLFIAEKNEQILGCIAVNPLADESAEFGMLAVDPEFRNKGIGKQLVETAEEWALKTNCSSMRLRLVVPLRWKHAHKEMLKLWYQRRGYQYSASEVFTPDDKEDRLATPCYCLVYDKNLKIPQFHQSVH